MLVVPGLSASGFRWESCNFGHLESNRNTHSLIVTCGTIISATRYQSQELKPRTETYLKDTTYIFLRVLRHSLCQSSLATSMHHESSPACHESNPAWPQYWRLPKPKAFVPRGPQTVDTEKYPENPYLQGWHYYETLNGGGQQALKDWAKVWVTTFKKSAKHREY